MGGGVLQPQHFDCDVSVEGFVIGEMDGSHSAFAEFADEAVGAERVVVADRGRVHGGIGYNGRGRGYR